MTTPRKNKKDRVSIVTKANVIKTTDGKFLRHLPGDRRGIPRHHHRRLVYRHHDRQADRREAPHATLRCSSCPTCTAISSPTRPPSSRAASAPPAAPTSASATPCSRPFTARLPAWWPRAARHYADPCSMLRACGDAAGAHRPGQEQGRPVWKRRSTRCMFTEKEMTHHYRPQRRRYQRGIRRLRDDKALRAWRRKSANAPRMGIQE